MEMEPAVEKGSGSNGEGNDGPGDTALLGCGKGKRRTNVRWLPRCTDHLVDDRDRRDELTRPAPFC